MSILVWILFGALAGWIASKIMKTDAAMGAVANIICGILGALVGGWISRALFNRPVEGFDLGSLLIAIGGACIVIFLWRWVSGGPDKRAY